MAKAAHAIDRVSRSIGAVAAWAALSMVFLQTAVVLARHLFGLASVFAQELTLYAHAVLITLGAAAALSRDRHVPIDAAVKTARPRTRAWIEIAGVLLLLLPFCAAILWFSLDYVAAAWAALEGSTETAGVPARFALKTLIPLFALLLALQGAASLLRALDVLRRRDEA
ncbi:MAG: TRAP transporter small permease subunit [Marivibrio sp.]|uniref:TRAP transporter small permease subunit n=1 Tax=Marivibrio sp. TaxID=2039719 RepID=UPI0032EDBF5C